MRNGRSGWEIAGGLALRGATVAAAMVLFSPAWPGEAVDGDGDDSEGGASWKVASASPFDVTRSKMRVREGEPFAFYVLEDEGGREVVRVTYLRSGGVVVNLGEAFPVRPGVSAEVDGTCAFGVEHGWVGYRLKIRPGGASGFSVADSLHGVRDGLGVDRDGEMVRDPSIAD